MKIIEHIPAFVSGVERNEADVNSLEELFALRWVGSWKRMGDEGMAFHQYSIAYPERLRPQLMAEFSEGRRWYVVGFILTTPLPEWLNLPTWEGKR